MALNNSFLSYFFDNNSVVFSVKQRAVKTTTYSLDDQLIVSVNVKNLGYAQSLIQSGANVNLLDSTATPLLHLIVKSGNYEMLQLFLENKANANISTVGRHFTALHLATALNEVEMCKLLIQYGADVCSFDSEGRSPYYIAKKNSGTHLAVCV